MTQLTSISVACLKKGYITGFSIALKEEKLRDMFDTRNQHWNCLRYETFAMLGKIIDALFFIFSAELQGWYKGDVFSIE